MNTTTPIHFFHGLMSGPHGTKYGRLDDEFDVVAPDFEGVMDIWDRVETAEEVTKDLQDLVVVGSSFGGLLAGLLYSRHPERFGGYVLMAPAFADDAADRIERMPDNAIVIHGGRDDVVPIESSRQMCTDYDVELLEVDDDHSLHDSLDLMVDAVRQVDDRI